MAVGLLVGLEREWAQKAVGVRTFAIIALLGTLAAEKITPDAAGMAAVLTSMASAMVDMPIVYRRIRNAPFSIGWQAFQHWSW